ncbi:MAG: hypothetical protein IT262_11800 [Saprospiraceae bacterium]|nr:hypothetical protein [Saprospiraceae bacterium]
MKKQTILLLLLLLSSLIGYLEWGGGNNGFLFELEAVVLQKLWSDPLAAIHPFTILPLIGQVLLLVALFQKKPAKALFISGLICLSTIMVLLLVIGVLSMHWKIIVCSLPFLITAVVAVMDLRKSR